MSETILLKFEGKYESHTIEEFNKLIYDSFISGNVSQIVYILESMEDYTKSIFLRDNLHKFSCILPFDYIITLFLTNIINFNFDLLKSLPINYDLEFEINKYKRYPNYSIKIKLYDKIYDFVLFKKTNNNFMTIINNLEIENKKNVKIFNDECKVSFSKLLYETLPNLFLISESTEYFLFFDNNLFFINSFVYDYNKTILQKIRLKASYINITLI